jgi:hypothetical protein
MSWLAYSWFNLLLGLVAPAGGLADASDCFVDLQMTFSKRLHPV